MTVKKLVKSMVRDVPWKGLGIDITKAKTLKEALKLASLDWTVEKTPIYVKGRGKYSYVESDEWFATKRVKDSQILGLVKKRYEVVQNEKAFDFINDLMKLGDIKLEVAGQIKGGRKVWLVAKLPEFELLGDKVQQYITFINRHDGTESVKAMITPIRLVCMNVLNLAVKKSIRSWSCKHSLKFEDRIQIAKASLDLSKNYVESLAEEAEKLNEIKISSFKDLTRALIPIDNKDAERVALHKEQDRQVILELIKADNLKKFDNSAWAFINAVSDFAFHRIPKREAKMIVENNWNRALSGNTLLDGAYEIVKRYA